MCAKRVAILGGGMAGLTAALHLTDPVHGIEPCDVTIYQMGWRLGGKCATGREPPHGPSPTVARVEEHGIHLFGGGYYNTLPMMARCYAELGRDFDGAFERQSVSLNLDAPPATPLDFLDLPRNNEHPASAAWTGSVAAWAERLLDFLSGLLEPGVRRLLAAAPALALPAQALQDLLQALNGARLAVAAGSFPLGDAATRSAQLAALAGRLGHHPVSSQLPAGHPARAKCVSLELGAAFAAALTAGFMADLARSPAPDFDRLDSERWDDWLRRHGATPAVLRSKLAISPLRILYQYPGGDHGLRPDMGAGAYLHWTLRTFAYVSAPFWFFTFGTGETLIEPLYTLLKERGVKFRFFHRVRALRLDAAGTRIARVDIDRQATPIGGDGVYDPLVPVPSVGRRCWPDRPLFAQLVEGPALSSMAPKALESYWLDHKVGDVKLLADRDFDDIVLAIPVGAHETIASDLCARLPQWQAMVAALPTVETFSAQWWLDRDSSALGSPIVGQQDPDDTGLGTGLDAPFDGVSDFSLLLAHEGWHAAARRPRSLWYFSDVLPGGAPTAPLLDPGYPARRWADAQAAQSAFMQVGRPLQRLLPGAYAGQGVDPALFVPVPGGSRGVAGQFLTANIGPTERYVQAPHATTHLRLAPDASGCSNLYLAGDWTRNGLNVGCVESAVMSGMLAARAIRGAAAVPTVVGTPAVW